MKSTRFFTEGHHFGHENIIPYANRPFDSVETMNELMVNTWNMRVKPNDVVYHLGDFALGNITQNLGYLKRLNGTKHLIKGNHDQPFGGYNHSNKAAKINWEAIYKEAGFASIQASTEVQIDGRWVNLCHFPYAGDSQVEDRFEEYRLEDEGIPLLHGHTHSPKNISRSAKGTLQINVGVDACSFMPVSEDEIAHAIEDDYPGFETIPFEGLEEI